MNLRKLAIIGTVISSAFLLSACSLYNSGSTSTSFSGGSNQSQQLPTSQASDAVTVKITDSGFSPSAVTVKSGGKVTFMNNSKATVQVASDPHPTHTANPELSNGQFVLELVPGASSTVTLTKTGTWGGHDHLNPGTKMKVTVQ